MKLVSWVGFATLPAPSFRTLTLPQGVRDLSGLKDWLAKTRTGFGPGSGGRAHPIAVNQTIVRDAAHPIRDSDEIAFLPPMSGG